MGTEAAHLPDSKAVERNTKRIDKLIREVEKLIDLLEEQRLVEPVTLIELKSELREIQQQT